MPKERLLGKVISKLKYICIEQNRKYLYSLVITKPGRKSNLQRYH